MLREGADLFVDHLAVVEEDQRRDRLDLEPPAHLWVVVGVDLDQLEVAGQLRRPASPGPGSPSGRGRTTEPTRRPARAGSTRRRRRGTRRRSRPPPSAAGAALPAAGHALGDRRNTVLGSAVAARDLRRLLGGRGHATARPSDGFRPHHRDLPVGDVDRDRRLRRAASPRSSARPTWVSTSREMYRRSGRAPYAGSKPWSAMKRRASAVTSRVIRMSASRSRSSSSWRSTMRSISASVSGLNITISSTRLRNSGRKCDCRAPSPSSAPRP